LNSYEIFYFTKLVLLQKYSHLENIQLDFQRVRVGTKGLIRIVKYILFNLYFQRMKDLNEII
jgi:hypothetical protein